MIVFSLYKVIHNLKQYLLKKGLSYLPTISWIFFQNNITKFKIDTNKENLLSNKIYYHKRFSLAKWFKIPIISFQSKIFIYLLVDFCLWETIKIFFVFHK